MNEKLRLVIKNLIIASILWGINVVINSSLSWAFAQKSFWASILEIYIVEIVLFFLFYYFQNNLLKICSIVITIFLYTYLHAFFWAFLVGIVYMTFIWLTGNLFDKYIIKVKQHDLIADMLMGMVGIIIMVAICSIFKVGTPHKLRIIFAITFSIELTFYLIHNHNRVSIKNKQHKFLNKKMELSTSLLCSSILTAFLLQLGRANICLDHDSMWYGLRSSSILAPFGGIFDKVISTGLVYIYNPIFDSF